jgi:hypothetical protein
MYTSSNVVARVVALVAIVSFVTACGGKDEEPAAGKLEDGEAAAGQVAEQPATAPAGSAAAANDRMANAVATSKSAAAVDLRYELKAKPEVGQPFELELAFLPRVAADVLEIEATGITGLTVTGGGTSRFENVAAGERYVCKVLAQAGAAGLYYVGVSAKMVTSVQSDVRTFSVPVVVGTVPVAEKSTEAPATGAAAAGDAVTSLPAVETTDK